MKAYAATDGHHHLRPLRPPSGVIGPQRTRGGPIDAAVRDLQRIVNDAARESAQRSTTLDQALEGVTVLERAKGIVMMHHDLNLAGATDLIHQWALLAGADVATIAQAVVKTVSFDPDLPHGDTSLARIIDASPGSLLG